MYERVDGLHRRLHLRCAFCLRWRNARAFCTGLVPVLGKHSRATCVSSVEALPLYVCVRLDGVSSSTLSSSSRRFAASHHPRRNAYGYVGRCRCERLSAEVTMRELLFDWRHSWIWRQRERVRPLSGIPERADCPGLMDASLASGSFAPPKLPLVQTDVCVRACRNGKRACFGDARTCQGIQM